MAASDKPFNNQRTLDIVFAVSNILMLLSVVWMFWQDHFREYKVEQRIYRDVQAAVAQRAAFKQIPGEEKFNKLQEAVTKTKKDVVDQTDELVAARVELAKLQPKKEKAEAKFQSIKADVDSITSLLSIALEHGDAALAGRYRNELNALNERLDIVQKDRDKILNDMKAHRAKIETIEEPHNKAVAAYKGAFEKLDAQVKLAVAKQWTIWDWLRTQPVINGFADPIRIHQFKIEDVPIDYNFAKVPRFDRCMTCHMGIDNPSMTRESLEALVKEESDPEGLKAARTLYNQRVAALGSDSKAAKTIPNPHDIRLIKITSKELTPARVNEFCVHPRLDLFVGANSKHPAEKFGCTSCHAGQGSGTSFNDASHGPNDIAKRNAWTKDHGWEHNHMWDYPMLPKRFVESSCLKCHHEVTDLISTDNRVEAPKLLKGYNLIKENGCFGCHEMHGWKSGQRVGPDLRLEPSMPLEMLHPKEQERIKNDTDNRPGNLRKVGPSLARVSQKVSENWMAKWIRSPSSFRPDTKMPHYYGLSTNDIKVLKDTAPKHEQDWVETFPNTEIASIAHFLTQNSSSYLQEAEKTRKDGNGAADDARYVALLNKDRLSEAEQKLFGEVKRRIRIRTEIPLVDLAPNYKGNAERGRVLFTERGCLACHTHQATETTQNSADAMLFAPPIKSDAVFGPNLSQVAAKFEGNPKAREWLIQWIMNPQVHSPRSRMPVTHLTPEQAADVAAWLMAQPAKGSLGADWNDIKVTAPKSDELKALAKVYLVRMMSKVDMDAFLDGTLEDSAFDIIKKDLPDDEQNLRKNVKNDKAMMNYLGKKAVGRLGCFACHDIPGFENTKSIGVGLNDWGKKDSSRLAFEDIGNFYRKHYYHDGIDSLIDKTTGKPHTTKTVDGKELEPYELFYKEALIGHFPSREGYLNQKIRDPRSYDFNRIRAWDDRARMPKFSFARPRQGKKESVEDFHARTMKEEAESREAVATFVLGLVAEPVPAKSINTPKGDRLAEVKGRQVLDKYNCNGCHLVRPGVYDFTPSEKTLDRLEKYHGNQLNELDKEYVNPSHISWTGRGLASGDRITAFGTHPAFDLKKGTFELRLSEAMRFLGKDKKSVKSVPAGVPFSIPIADLAADTDEVKTQAEFDQRFMSNSAYGGTFADIMVPWLRARDKERVARQNALPRYGDDNDARAVLPPSLIGQGERTQATWLYQFLEDPTSIRRMAILRMPKFNLSPDERGILRDYFAAVTKQINPGIGLSHPDEIIASRQDFSGEYWTKKTAAYLEYLKNTDEVDKEGKNTGKKLYKAKVAEYEPLWEQIRKERELALAENVKKIKEFIKTKTAERDALEKAKVKDDEKIKDLTNLLAAKDDELKGAEDAIQKNTVANQRDNWEKQEAYVADAYRLLTSRELCTKCHQVGSITAGERVKEGPPLALAADRLRPAWIERWINKPTRMAYGAVMPSYFDKNEMRYQALHAGPGDEQIRALRDVLLNLDRVSRLEINRRHDPDRK